jgi:hypothetical protein
MQSRDALTVRFPPALLSKARELKTEYESLNDLVIEAVEREVRRRQGLQAYASIMRLYEGLKCRTGLQPDSSSLIRELREGTRGSD